MITPDQLAQLFIIHIFSKHGVPSHITSNQGPKLVSHQTLEQYIQVYCNYQQDNWSGLLPLAKFAYNNAPSATTGITLFYANKGYHLNITVHPECDLASAHAQNFITDLDKLHQQLKQHIADAQH